MHSRSLQRRLNLRIDAWSREQTLQAIVERVERYTAAPAEQKAPTTHAQVNIAKWMMAQRDPRFLAELNQFSIVNVDGQGLLWGLRLLGLQVPERVTGIDLMMRLIEVAAERRWKVFLLGGAPDVAAIVASRLRARYPSLPEVGSHDGFFWGQEERLVEIVRAHAPHLVFVGITSPKQEEVILQLGPRFGTAFLSGVGGSFDVLAGRVARAPLWMQKSGLEWFFRLLQEPRRLFWRYFTSNLAFLGWVIKILILKNKK